MAHVGNDKTLRRDLRRGVTKVCALPSKKRKTPLAAMGSDA